MDGMRRLAACLCHLVTVKIKGTSKNRAMTCFSRCPLFICWGKDDLFATLHYRETINWNSGLIVGTCVTSGSGCSASVDASRVGRPAYSTSAMVRILIIKQLYNLSDEQWECAIDRMSYQGFCGWENLKTMPDRTTI